MCKTLLRRRRRQATDDSRGPLAEKSPKKGSGSGKVAEGGADPHRLAGEENEEPSQAAKGDLDFRIHLGKAAAHSRKDSVAPNWSEGCSGKDRGRPVKRSKEAPGLSHKRGLAAVKGGCSWDASSRGFLQAGGSTEQAA